MRGSREEEDGSIEMKEVEEMKGQGGGRQGTGRDEAEYFKNTAHDSY